MAASGNGCRPQCDRATEAYLAATQQFPLDGSVSLNGAKAADDKALKEIKAARQAIARFRSQHSRPIDEADMLIRNLPKSIQEAQVALTAARRAVADAENGGFPSRRAAQKLAEAEQTGAGIDITAGLRERSTVAQRTLELARSATTLAADAPRTAQSVRSALRSVSTRREAATTKLERIEPALSALRREFSEPCSRDLVDAERVARAAIAAAGTALGSRGAAGRAGRMGRRGRRRGERPPGAGSGRGTHSRRWPIG